MTMLTESKITANTVWFLVGPFDSAETIRYYPIHSVPFTIGRRSDLSLALSCQTVSGVHAEISEAGSSLVLRDLSSTNGTYVNGQRISKPVVLRPDDLVQFANMAFRVRQQSAPENFHTVAENVCDQALALVQFDKLMAERAVTPFFQPILSLQSDEIIGHEVLARTRLFGLETPKEMFSIAAQLNLEIELSIMLRWEGVLAAAGLNKPMNLFLNTHPHEIEALSLLASLQVLRTAHPNQALTLEIHESAMTDAARIAAIRPVLRDLDIALAYDDFGAGQSRLNELTEGKPDYVKFDMSLIRDIDSASPQRQHVVATLVQMVHELGIFSLAEGVETQAEADTCRQMGFDLGQGYFYGRPAPVRQGPAEE